MPKVTIGICLKLIHIIFSENLVEIFKILQDFRSFSKIRWRTHKNFRDIQRKLGTGYCATVVPIGVIYWYRLECYAWHKDYATIISLMPPKTHLQAFLAHFFSCADRLHTYLLPLQHQTEKPRDCPKVR